MTHKRQLWQTFFSFSAISVFFIAIIVFYTVNKSRHLIKDIYFEELQVKGHVVARLIEPQIKNNDFDNVNAELNRLFFDLKSYVTVILPNGKVIADTRKDPSLLDNHADRPEIKEALLGHVGRNIRYSYSVNKELLYLALPIFNNEDNKVIAVVRMSMPYQHADQVFSALQYQIILILLLGFLLILVLFYVVARRFSQPLLEVAECMEKVAAGDFKVRLPDFSAIELHRISAAFNQLIERMEDQLHKIHEQKNQQQAIFQSMNEGILAVNKEERIIAINRAAAEILNISADAKNRSMHEVIRNSELIKVIEQALATDQLIEDEIVCRGEPRRYIQVHGTCLKDEAGNTIGAMVVLSDVTRIKRLEEIRKDFVANVSHEIRTPLTSIQGFVETLLDGALADKETAERFLNIIHNQTRRLNMIIEDLMVLASLEQKEERSEFQFSEDYLAPVVQNAILVCQSQADDKNIRITSACPEKLKVKMNPSLLEQALVNLITNAIKYSPENTEVKIEVTPGEREVEIKVVDQGIGIPSDYHDRIFERFYRVDKARSRQLGGTGLGLSIVKHIVNVHNGRVAVESKVGKGSTFYIYLPYEKS
ncbi:two-component system histidine kinase PnpS [Caldithrix abyssi]